MTKTTKVALSVGALVLVTGGALAYVLTRKRAGGGTVAGDVLFGDPTVITSDPNDDCGAGCYLSKLIDMPLGSSGDAAGRD